MDEDTVDLHEEVNEVVETQEVPQEEQTNETLAQEQKQVPLSALQKERRKRQEIELELQWERKRQVAPASQPVEEDNSKYETATREDVSRAQEESLRIIEERLWIKNNPEKYEKINENLPQFLKQRPNLASAINMSTNRYEEAYTLMEALTPKQQQQLKSVLLPKKDAPGSPGSVSKAATLNQSVDVMNMSDSEFSAWRQSQKRRR